MSTDHASRNLQQLELLREALPAPLRPTVGSGYRPSAWCKNCSTPYDVGECCCPECGHPQTPPVQQTPALGTCSEAGCGTACTGLICSSCLERRL
ncbi:hypothetical protein Dcar01_02794 [Deinococcus carri]|uniref:Uncharacterized protein n=1 Tax=Deinococcus carri TaxID=1211323 RepID=A0ABP9WBC2_9DEIO